MLKLSVNDIVKNKENCYSFVAAISKRARQISEELQEEEDTAEEKPVQLAVEEFMEGKFKIVQPDLNAEAKADAEQDAEVRAEKEKIERARAEEKKKTGKSAD
ncbi:MAG TPA: hypothetical protein DEP42_04175 [Ruminococcaceae bacterium]|nr:hypothetical protein [Oscillospiraceae bacterium]